MPILKTCFGQDLATESQQTSFKNLQKASKMCYLSSHGDQKKGLGGRHIIVMSGSRRPHWSVADTDASSYCSLNWWPASSAPWRLHRMVSAGLRQQLLNNRMYDYSSLSRKSNRLHPSPKIGFLIFLKTPQKQALMATNMMSNHTDRQGKYCGDRYDIHCMQNQQRCGLWPPLQKRWRGLRPHHLSCGLVCIGLRLRWIS